jgi:hypothetical protein
MSTVAEYRELVQVDEPRLTVDEARRMLREAVAQDLGEGGADRETVLAVLDYLRRKAREDGREQVEDVVMDVMDYVVGFCNPRMQL